MGSVTRRCYDGEAEDGMYQCAAWKPGGIIEVS